MKKTKIGPPAKFQLAEEPDDLSFTTTLNGKKNYYQEALKQLDEMGGGARV